MGREATVPSAGSSPQYDAFISYSRQDAELARRLEAALERYRPPRGLGLPQRHLRIFRDEADFTGTEYAASLERNLAASSKLLLLCSPASRASRWVDGEIELFAGRRGAEQIVTVLVDGVPNNEVAEGEEGPRAFPERLVRLLPLPLAADYRGFDPAADRVDRGRFQAAWFKLLADLFQESGVSRAQLEQREERRRRRRRAIVGSVTAAVMLALAALATWAWIERGQAIRNRNLAVARQLVAEAELSLVESPTRPEKSLLLAIEGFRREPSADADRVLRRAAAVIPEVAWVGRHPAAVRAATFLPDGRRLASGAEDGSMRLWEVATGTEAMRLELGAPVRALAASSGGDRLVAGGADGRVRLIDLASGSELWAADTASPILRVGFVAGAESVVAVGRAEGSRHLGLPLVVHRIAVGGGAIESFELPGGVGLDAGGRLLLTYDGLWDAAGAEPGIGEAGGGEPIVAFQDLGSGYGQVVRSAALSGDGRLVALGVRDSDPYAERGAGSLRLLEESGRRRRWVREFAGGIEALAFSPASDRVLTAGEDGTVRVLDTDDGRELRRLSHAGRPRAVAWHPDGESFATAGDDGELRLYRLRDAAPGWRATPPPGPSLVTLSADGRRLASLAHGDRPARTVVWEVGGGRLGSFELDPAHDFMEPRPLAFAEGGERLLLASLGGGRERRASAGGALVEQRTEEGRPIVLIAESPDGRWTATGSWDQWLWMEGSGEWRIELSHRPTALAFTADSGRLLAGSEDGRVLVLDSAAGERLGAFDYPGMVTAVAADAEGGRVAIGGSDGTARVLDLAGGALEAVIPLGGEPAGLAFVEKGAMLRSARSTAKGEILVEDHPLLAAALVRLACSRLTVNLAASEWRDHLGPEPPRATCAELPIPPG